MQAQEWRQALGECVRDFFRTPEMEHFYSIKMTAERARIYLLQLGLYARQRRNNWPQVAANCPEFEVKQRILAHEYEELVEDEHSKTGHMDLIVRQGNQVGLSADEVINVDVTVIAERPKLRYMIGRKAKIAVALKRFVPGELFERLYFGIIMRRVTRPTAR